MYKIPNLGKSSIDTETEAVVGEILERKIERLLLNGEPIEEPNRQLIFTERKDGVIDAYNIKADKWEVAVEASERITRSFEARREERLKPKVIELDEKKNPEGSQHTEA